MDDQTLLSTAETAEALGISTASVRNWIKHGYLQKISGGFDKKEVELLLQKIQSGEIDRLNRRANKRETAGFLAPDTEYKEICSQLCILELETAEIMWLTAINLFRLHGSAADKPVTELAALAPTDYSRETVRSFLHRRLIELSIDTESPAFRSASAIIDKIRLPKKEPADSDIAGIIYQAVCRRGTRSASGSFYTPAELTGDLISSALQKLSAANRKPAFIDPCCGSGQFILSFIKAGGSVDRAVGIDSDASAVFTAGVNLLLQCPDYESAPKVFKADSLLSELPDAVEQSAPFDLTATNPPWGAATTGLRKALKKRYPFISSGESYSYFISRCLELVRPGGIVSLVLPESILNITRHKDIRTHILKNSLVNSIIMHGKVFSNVFTPVISMELIKSAASEKENPSRDYSPDCFNININNTDAEIIDSIYDQPHTTLEGKAQWALGIVTGNNAAFITDRYKEGLEPIIRGSDIKPDLITGPSSFIRFEPENFQQAAPEWKYRSAEKLVYRFISKRLIFAVDKDRRLTLNSANIIIPDTKLIDDGWNAENISACFNSDICNFIFRKRFNSVKVLRSHLEQLPLLLRDRTILPYLTDKQIKYVKNFNL